MAYDGLITSYLGSGTAAARPTTPNVTPGAVVFYYATDTAALTFFNNGAWHTPTSTGGSLANSVTWNNSGSGAASGATFNGSSAVTISYNTIGAQASNANLTAYAGANWSAGTQIAALTAANTVTLKTIGNATGNILDKAAGDSLYQPIGSYLTANQMITLSGDATGSGTTAITVTLANTAVTAGTYGDATHSLTATVDAKGRITAMTAVAITPAWSSITSTPTSLNGYGIVPNIQSVTSASTVTPTFTNDQVNITAQAAALTLANPTGTAVPAWGLSIRIKDNGTPQTISYGTQYRAMGVTLPTTTVAGKTVYLGMIYNSTDTTWDVVAVAQQA